MYFVRIAFETIASEKEVGLRILMVQDSLGTGGAERSNADLSYYLRAQGHAVKVVVLRSREDGVQKEVLAAGLDVVFLTTGSAWSQAKALRKILDSWRPNIVHAVLFKASMRARLAQIGPRRFPLVESLVNTTYDPARLSDPALSWLKLKGYQLVDAITAHLFTDHFHAITETVSRHHQRAWWLPSKQLSIIPRGRQPNPYIGRADLRQHYQELWGIAAEDFVIITTGRQEFQKGQVHLLRALALARKRGLTNFKYLMLGREGYATAQINQTITDLALAPYVIQAGHRSDVEKILSIGQVFAFPSVYEGLGVSLIEAQAAGLPILCNDIPVFREVTRPGENAWLIPVSHTEAWAEALLRLSREADTRMHMGQLGQQHFLANYQLDKVHKRMLDLLKNHARA